MNDNESIPVKFKALGKLKRLGGGLLFLFLSNSLCLGMTVNSIKIIDENGQSVQRGIEIVNSLRNLPFALTSVNQVLKKLFAAGYYRQIQVEVFEQEGLPSRVSLIFNVKWRQQIKNISVVYTQKMTQMADLDLNKTLKAKVEYHPTSVAKIKDNVRAFLQNHGYFSPDIQVKAAYKGIFNEDVFLNIRVTPHLPCFVSHVEISSDQPVIDKLLQIPLGMICDVDRVNLYLDQAMKKIIDKGYYNLSYQMPRFKYDPEDNTAMLEVIIKYGTQINYRIKDVVYDPFLAKERDKVVDFSNLESEEVLFKLEDFYKERGYYFVEIELTEEQSETPFFKPYSLVVNAGPQVMIKNFQVEGYNLDPAALEQIIDPNRLVLFNTVFSEKAVRERIQAVESIYFEEGYADVKVGEPEYIFSSDKKQVSVKVTVEAGKPYVIKSFSFTGNKAISNTALHQFIPKAKVLPLNQNIADQITVAIKNAYLIRGFIHARVKMIYEIKSSDVENSLHAEIQVVEGHQVIIDEISILGLRFTKTQVVQRELTIKSGSIYSPQLITQTRSKLLRIGLFESVVIEPRSGFKTKGGKDYVVLDIKIIEKKPGTIEFKPGWGTYKGARFSMELSYTNLGGFGGRKVFQSLKVSQEAQQKKIDIEAPITGYEILVGFTEPYIANFNLQGTITFLQSASAEKQFHIYNRSLEFNLVRYVFQSIRTTGAYKIKSSRYVRDDVDIQTASLLSFDRVRIGSLLFSSLGDWRDDPKWPLKGGVLSFAANIARRQLLLSDIDFNRFVLFGSVYQRLYKKIGLNLRIQSGVIQTLDQRNCGIDNASICLPPEDERFFAGGTGSVRGFVERSLGPEVVTSTDTQTSEAVGGTLSFVSNLEIKFPSPIYRNQLGWLLFFDAGNVYYRKSEVAALNIPSLRESVALEGIWDVRPDNLKKGVGLGIVVLPNLFQIHIDYGIPWSKIQALGLASALEGRLHINIGGVL